MTDKPEKDAEQNEQQLPPLSINGQYIKDLSFESPNAPSILSLLQNATPEVSVNVDVNASEVPNDDDVKMYEVVLDIKAELKVEEQVGFITELQYAGVFTLNVPDEHLSAVLLIECPRLLFPYARNLVSDTTRDGGFVPLFLQPIDFAAMYQANIARQTEDAEKDKKDQTVN